MRKMREGSNTKDIVIAAAKVAFADHGYAGTSLAKIAEQSGVSEGLILHHFKNKKNLYHTVLEDLANAYIEAISQAMAEGEDKEQAAMGMLRAIFRFWNDDTLYNRIALWAYLEDRTELIDEEVRLTGRLAATVQRMQAQGSIDQRYDPFVLLTMTIGPIHFWTRYRMLFREALHLEAAEPELDAAFLEQYIALISKMYHP